MTQKLTEPICFLTTRPMYEKIQKASEKREISVSYLLRSLIRDFLQSEGTETNNPRLRRE